MLPNAFCKAKLYRRNKFQYFPKFYQNDISKFLYIQLKRPMVRLHFMSHWFPCSEKDMSDFFHYVGQQSYLIIDWKRNGAGFVGDLLHFHINKFPHSSVPWTSGYYDQ